MCDRRIVTPVFYRDLQLVINITSDGGYPRNRSYLEAHSPMADPFHFLFWFHEITVMVQYDLHIVKKIFISISLIHCWILGTYHCIFGDFTEEFILSTSVLYLI